MPSCSEGKVGSTPFFGVIFGAAVAGAGAAERTAPNSSDDAGEPPEITAPNSSSSTNPVLYLRYKVFLFFVFDLLLWLLLKQLVL